MKLTVDNLIAELLERPGDALVEIEGRGEIADIEITPNNRVILIGEDNEY